MVTTILQQLASHSRLATSATLPSQSLPQDIGRVRIYGQVKAVARSPHQKTVKENISIFVKKTMGRALVWLGNKIIALGLWCKRTWNKFLSKLMFNI
jgi:hypothetical protein